MKTVLCVLGALALATAAFPSESLTDQDWTTGPVVLAPRTSDPLARVAELEEQKADARFVLTLGARFDPLRGAAAADPTRGFRDPHADPGRTQPFLLQFHQEIGPADREWLSRQGFEVLRFVPSRALLVRGDPGRLGPLTASGRVRAVEPYRPQFKVLPELFQATYAGRQFLQAALLPGADAALVLEAARPHAPSLRPLVRHVQAWGTGLVVEVDGAELPAAVVALANDERTETVDLWSLPEPHNNDSIWMIQSADTVNRQNYAISATAWNHEILGTGQIVAVSDTRFDADACQFTRTPSGWATPQYPTPPDPGILDPSKKVIGHVLLPRASPEGSSDHGTHTAGSVAGDNLASLSTPSSPGHDFGDGMAPQAQLFLQGLSSPSSSLIGALTDPYLLSEQAWNAGARIQTNSWGAQVPGAVAGYDYTCLAKDLFTWDHEEFLHIFSVGNEGLGPNDRLARPAVAKNVIGVAATTHGSANSLEIADFTANGPALDGRVKPDIAAPGEFITSAASNGVVGDGNCGTKSISGTSMAAPTMAGAATLVRQYFTDGFYPSGARVAGEATAPAAALIKAVLINSAVDLETANMPTDPQEGWGRILLDNALYFPGDPSRLRAWDKRNADGLTTAAEDVYTVQVTAGRPFKATLVWTDPPSATAAATNLVNNLDLEVTAPGGTYRGNRFSGGQSVPGGAADAINNVEQVLLPAPTSGTYTVRVKATSVPGNAFTPDSDRQGYALVVTAALCASAVSAAPAGFTAADAGPAGAHLSWSAGPAVTYEILRAAGTCAAPESAFTSIGQTAGTSFDDATVQGGKTYAYRVRGADGCGVGPATCAQVTSTASCTLAPDFMGLVAATSIAATAACDVTLSWTAATSSCPLATGIVYNVYRSISPAFTPSGANRVATGVVTTIWTDTSVGPLTPQYYVVRAEDSTTLHGGPANGGNEDSNSTTLFVTPEGDGSMPGDFIDDAGDTSARLILDPPWRISAEQNNTPGGGFSYKTGPDGLSYPPGVCAAATTPPIVLGPGTPELRYSAAYNMELQWDGVVLEISLDDGATWTPLTPRDLAGAIERYPGFLSGHSTTCVYGLNQGAFNNHPFVGLVGFYEARHDLAEYAGRTVRLRWNFTSDSSVENIGLYLDDIRVTHASTARACGPAGFVELDRTTYTCAASVGVGVSDSNRAGAGSLAVIVSSGREPVGESVILTESPSGSGRFAGAVPTTSAAPVAGNGWVSVSSGDTLRASYLDANPGSGPAVGQTDEATIDCDDSTIRDVRAVDIREDAATIVWTTDEWSDSVVRFATTPPPSTIAVGPQPATRHAVRLEGLQPCTQYFFSVESTDDAGNSALDDNAGAWHTFATGKRREVLATSSHGPLSIPDLSTTGVSSALTVSDARRVSDVVVEVDVAHPQVGELDLTLTAPGGSNALLAGYTATSLGANLSGTVFDDSAYGTLAGGVAPFSFRYDPIEPLASLDGTTGSGSWTLAVTDTETYPLGPAHSGQLLEWGLQLTMEPGWCVAHASRVGLTRVSDTCSAGGTGQGNAYWDPGEAVQFALGAVNDGTIALTGATVTVTPLTRGVAMLDGTATLPPLPVGATATTAAPHVTAQLPTYLQCGDIVRFLVDVQAPPGTWSGIVSQRIGDDWLPNCGVVRCNAPSWVPDGILGTSMTASRLDLAGATIAVTWDASTCSSPDHHILYGSLGSVSTLDVAGSACDIGTSGAHTWASVPPADLWFLVVGDSDSGTEGSWGLGATGHRRGIEPSGECGTVARDNEPRCP